MPFHCDDTRTDRWSFETLSELNSLSSNSSSGDLVEVLPAVAFHRNEDKSSDIPAWATDAKAKSLSFRQLHIDDLYEESKSRKFRLPRKEVMVGAGYSHAWLFHTPIIDAPKMLMHMLEEIEAHQYTDHVDVETNKYYTTIEEMLDEAKALGCDGLVNCTGMGSKQLCNDDSLIGARGVLLHYDRASCVWRDEQDRESTEKRAESLQDSVILIEDPPFGSETMPCYMIPRGEIIAVGGSYLEGDEERIMRQTEIERVVGNAQKMGIDVEKSNHVGAWVGFRPYRPTSRLELDEEVSSASGVKLVHSYGYGGSGWTVFVGAAKEAASLM